MVLLFFARLKAKQQQNFVTIKYSRQVDKINVSRLPNSLFFVRLFQIMFFNSRQFCYVQFLNFLLIHFPFFMLEISKVLHQLMEGFLSKFFQNQYQKSVGVEEKTIKNNTIYTRVYEHLRYNWSLLEHFKSHFGTCGNFII